MLHIKNLTDFAKPESTTLPEIIGRIKNDPKIKAICARVRKATKTDARRIKKELPAFVLGEFDGKITNAAFIRSDYLLYDIDNLADDAQVAEIKEKVKPLAALVFVSPSGLGVKFAIRMKTPVDATNYRGNYEHYADYLTDYLGVELDRQTKDPSRKTYYAHDPGVYHNSAPPEYPAAKIVTVDKVNNVDDLNIDKDELADVCAYLADYRLSFMEWTMAAMALQHVDNGLQLFTIISKNKYYKDSDDVIRRKFVACNSVSRIGLGSLFWLAMEHGYKRNKKFLKSGGTKYPFEIEREGSFYRDAKDNYIWVFGWKQIEYLYDVREIKTKDGRDSSQVDIQDGGSRLLARLKIDHREISIPASALTSGTLLKKEITDVLSLHIVHGRTDNYFDMLSQYLHRTRNNAEVLMVHGVGKILPNLYNWGNYVILDGNVYDFEPLIWTGKDKITGKDTGYALDDYSNIRIIPRTDVKAKLKRMHYFYGDQLSIAIGWAIANIYFDRVIRDYGGFPILFLHGDTGKGKTKLGTMLLAMFGVANPDTDKNFKASLSDMTHVAGGRMKNKIHNMPTFFDEYNCKHYLLLKSLFDGSGRITAIKDMTDRVKQYEVNGGTITAGVIRPHEKEVLNRCIYFDVMKSVDDTKSVEFNREFMVAGAYSDLSALAINVAVKNLGDKYMEILQMANQELMKSCMKTTEAIGRITTNYAIAYAGYKLLVNYGVIDEWTSMADWVGYANETVQAISESDPVEAFLFICKKFAMENLYPNYITTSTITKDDATHVRLTIIAKYILPEIQDYCRRRNIYYDLIGMNTNDLTTRLRNSIYFVSSKTIVCHGSEQYSNNRTYAREYIVDVPLDEEEESSELTEIPF